MEKIEKSNDLIFMKCRHSFHKPCYLEWLKYSTYESPICIICRNIAFEKKEKQNKKLIKITGQDELIPIKDIMNTLGIKKKNTCNCHYEDCYTKIFKCNSPDHSPPNTPKKI